VKRRHRGFTAKAGYDLVMPKRQTESAQTPRGPGEANGTAEEPGHSGRLLLRMPPSLHGELARAADTDGVSLNQFITSTLAAAIGARRSGSASAAEAATPPRGRRGRNALLTLNLIVLVVLAALAIVLLVTAWHQS
jgi:hypothetical protein